MCVSGKSGEGENRTDNWPTSPGTFTLPITHTGHDADTAMGTNLTMKLLG